MAFSRSLLIKGVAGLGTCAAGGIVIHQRENIFGKREINLNSFTDKQLIDKVGLDCQLGDNDNEVTETKECSVKTNGKINVKNDKNSEDDVTFQNSDSGGAKLKVSKSTEGGYSKNLKFVVDSGDINLTREGTSPTISKLEQFETYEVTAEKGGKFYLSRKIKAKEEKEKALGLLGKCELPATGDSTCTFNTEEIKKVKFDGVTDGVVLSSGEVTLKISKMNDTTTFPDGYRFTFTFPSDVTIGSNTVKGNIPTDFKIKKPNTGNAITLEKAWKNNEFAEKVGLTCTGSNGEECCTKTGEKLNVKVGDKKKEGITSLTMGSGKIKLEKDQQGYNQGFKFTITTGDISITDGTGDSSITKLEELETYEITEENGKYYLTKKSEKDEKIKTSLGLPTNCNLPTTNSPVECTVPADKSKNVKFDGQETNKPQVEFKLKIEKTNDTLYPLGYKFTLISEKEVTISTSNSVKANTNTVFKIKKDTSNPANLTLEKFWEISKLLEKVGLSGCTTESTDCSIKSPSGPLNIKRNSQTISATAISTGKIKFKKDQADYNQGFKFTIEENDVTLTATGVSAPNNKLEELETYEITEQEGNYYLTRKTTKEEAIKKSLSIPDSCFKTLDSLCSLTTTELSKINFDAKEAGKPTVAGNGGGSKASLTVSKVTNTTDFPLGYKFTFLTTGEMTISNTNKVKANIPTEFKIKKESSGLSLEKAWSDVSKFIEKVGLEGCSGNGNTTDCTIKTTGSQNGLNVKQGDAVHEGKSKSNDSSGKIKLYKDQKGYIEGMKFVIEENDVTLTNTGSDIKLTQYETYEIEQKDGKYYLSRKTDGKEEKIKKLGLPEDCKWEESSASAASQICSITQQALKSVKFKNKKSNDSQSSVGNENENITVMFEEAKAEDATTHPLGLKISFVSLSKSDINIPLNGSNGEAIVLKPSTKKEFKITKEENGGDLSLERAFDINEFVKDSGLQNCYDNLGCSLKEKINVWMGENEYRVDAPVATDSTSHKITYEEGKSGGYNKGVKFTLSGDITLQAKNESTETSSKGTFTTLKASDEYQIIKRTVGSAEKCFLSKVSS